MSKTLFIFRHGETDWNRDGRMQGGTDVPLNETGRQQAMRLRKFFVQNPVDVFLSSHLSRARETAEIAAGYPATRNRYPIVIDERLRETNLGDAEGLTQEEFVARYGPKLLEEWRAFPERDHARFPNGETKAEHLQRVFESLEEFVSKTPHSRIAVATHGGSMRRLIHHWCPELPSAVMVGNCVAYKATFDPTTKLWTLETEPICGNN